MPNGFSHHHQLDESVSNLRLLGSMFQFHSNFGNTFCKQTVETLIRRCFAASDLGLHCLLISHKKNARLMLVKALLMLNP